SNTQKVHSENHDRKSNHKKRSANYELQKVVSINEVGQYGTWNYGSGDAESFQIATELRELASTQNVSERCQNRYKEKRSSQHFVKMTEWLIFLNSSKTKINSRGYDQSNHKP